MDILKIKEMDYLYRICNHGTRKNKEKLWRKSRQDQILKPFEEFVTTKMLYICMRSYILHFEIYLDKVFVH